MNSSRLCHVAFLGIAFSQLFPAYSLAIEVRGVVLDSQKSPVGNLNVVARSGLKTMSAETNAKGEFTFQLPEDWDRSVLFSVAKDGGRQQAWKRFWQKVPASITLQLQPARRIAIHVTDKNGKPIADAHAGVFASLEPFAQTRTNARGQATAWVPGDATVECVYALKSGHGLDYKSLKKIGTAEDREKILNQPFQLHLDGAKTIRVRVEDKNKKPLAGVRVYPWLMQKPSETESLNLGYLHDLINEKTNAQGMVEFDWIPQWQEKSITLWVRPDQRYISVRGSIDPKKSDKELTIALEKTVPLRGRVSFPDGKPAVNIKVLARGNTYAGQQQFDDSTYTDANGRYEFLAYPNQLYMVIVRDDEWAAKPLKDFAIYPNQPCDNMDIQLLRGTKVVGRVNQGTSPKGVPGENIRVRHIGSFLYQLKDINIANPDDRRDAVLCSAAFSVTTDADGRYQFRVGPGIYWVDVPNRTKIRVLDINDEKELTQDFSINSPDHSPLKTIVLKGDSRKPVSFAQVDLVYLGGDEKVARKLRFRTNENGIFTAKRLNYPIALVARNADQSLAGVAHVDANAKEATVLLHPTGEAKGRLLDHNGKPLANHPLTFDIDFDYSPGENTTSWFRLGGIVRTDKDGHFEIKNLVLGQAYVLEISLAKNAGLIHVLFHVTDENKTKDLGVLKRPELPRPPTPAERVAKAFTSDVSPAKRYAKAVKDARLAKQHIIVLFASSKHKLTEQLYVARWDNQEVANVVDSYQVVSVSTEANSWDAAEKLAKALKVSPKKSGEPLLCLFDNEEVCLAISEMAPLLNNGELDRTLYKAFLQAHLPRILDARELLEDALARAKKENKKIILQETATWCPPCWLLSRYLDRQRAHWQKDFLWVKIDRRWKHADTVLQRFRQNPKPIPWLVIIDSQKKILGMNEIANEVYGFPSSRQNINHFMTLLSSNRQRMTDADLQAMRQALEKRE